MTLPYILSTHSVTFYVDGVPYSAHESTPGYPEIKNELKKADPDTDRLILLTQPIQAVREAVAAAEADESNYLPAGKVSITLSEIRYDGEVVQGVLVDRILSMLAEGFDIMPMVRFLENLYLNPATYAREELYLWLENSNLPITEDGHFLAYKRVNGNFTSIHDGKTKNDVGTVVSMPRSAVDTVRDHTCSTGLHFCSKSYLPHFGSNGNGQVTVLVKINPADVVSIPSDYDNAKGRAWQYEVLSVVDFDPQVKEWAAVTSADGSTVVFDDSNDDDDDAFYDDGNWDDDEPTDDEVEVERIENLGIIDLRREASNAGYVGAWKGPKAEDLRTWLIDRV